MVALLVGVLMSLAHLSIGTATDRIDLLELGGWRLTSWRPTAGPHLGSFAESALADYRAMKAYRDLTTVETFNLRLIAREQDQAIVTTQNLRRMLRKAIDYWATDWQGEPVYLAAQASCETNRRYAIVVDGSLPDDDNPFAQPFHGIIAAGMDDMALGVERGAWLENPPGERTCVQVSGEQEWLYNQTTVTGRPGASTDDGFNHPGETGLNLTEVQINLGYDGSAPDNAFIRFGIVNIPPGSVIISAYVTFISNDDLSTDICRVRIYGEDTDDAATFSDYANYIVRPRTSASVAWVLGAWTVGDTFNTPDLTTVIQEIIDRPGWLANNDLVLFFDDDGSTPGAYREAISWDDLVKDPPVLTIVYASGGDYGRSPTCNNEVFIANKQNKAQLTHAYHWESAAGPFSANLIGAVKPVGILPAAPADGDTLYFGVQSSLTNSGPFCSLVFDIGTAAVYVGAAHVHWYYSTGGGGWAALTVYDNTGYPQSFRWTGVKSIHWQQPSNWATDTVNGVTGYWVKCVLTIGGGESISTPTQQNRDIYTVTWGSVLIDDGQVPGDIPALLQVWLKNPSGLYAGQELNTDLIVAGLRGTDRGEDFSAYINLSDEQNPPGIVFDWKNDSATGPVADSRAVTGSWVVATPAAPHDWIQNIIMEFGAPTGQQYVGTYHAYIRAEVVKGGGGATAGDWGMRIAQGTFWYLPGATVYSAEAFNKHTDIIELFDLGRISIPTHGQPNDMGNWVLNIEAFAADDDFTVRIHDLVLIPVDEWAVHTQSLDDLVAGSFTYTITGGGQSNGYDLDIDGVTRPKKTVSMLYNRSLSELYEVMAWRYSPNKWPCLTANRTQRLWMLAATPHWTTYLYQNSQPYTVHAPQLYRNARYLSMRGNR